MTVETDIQAALLTHLKTPALTGSPPIAYPLISFTPTPGVSYLDAHPILRAAPDHPFLDFSAPTILRGVFQVDAVTPDNVGEGVGLRLAELVKARFAIGTTLTAGAYTIRLQRVPTIAAAVKDAPWVRFPVSIPYLVIT